MSETIRCGLVTAVTCVHAVNRGQPYQRCLVVDAQPTLLGADVAPAPLIKDITSFKPWESGAGGRSTVHVESSILPMISALASMPFTSSPDFMPEAIRTHTSTL